MPATRADPLEAAIPPETSVLIDSSVVLAYLTGTEAVIGLATQLFDAFIATGRNPASLSVITVGEILVTNDRAWTSRIPSLAPSLRTCLLSGIAP